MDEQKNIFSSFLKKLHETFDDHFIKYGKLFEDNIENPVEIRVRKGRFWSATYFPEELISDNDQTETLIRELEQQIERERNSKAE